ncbi:hypothetical protein GPJ56_005594 [Histomonas meleagridis]|uniref:uncharacterized protein n=1 Tax=Histomonas meleagridis TaxID=135588 RepID=UPI00355AAE45|nr:hypothetical protein GPJ56_005594 [Histomonas meleagridis]KAH0799893.1 hypothetical protein GO595_007005 [Histomonas meleagridis]
MSGTSKKKILANINSVVENAKNEVKHYRREVKHLRKFMDNLTIIVEHECPEFTPKMTQISGKFYNSLACEERFINAYERLSEDFNDIAERFNVLYRASMASIDAKNHYKQRSAKYEKQKEEVRILAEKGSSKRIKAEAELAKNKEKKDASLAEAIKKEEELLVVQDRFTKFKCRRLKHAYTFLAKEMRATMKQILEDSKAIRSICSDNSVAPNEQTNIQNEPTNTVVQEEQAPQYATYQEPPAEVPTYSQPNVVENPYTSIPQEPQETYTPFEPQDTYTSFEPQQQQTYESRPEETYMFIPTFD